MISCLQRLAAGEWFTARVSSCGLFHIAYPSAPDQLKAELRSIYGQLCQDDMPMVRRAAASNLGKFAATVEQNYLKTEIMSIFDDLTQDGTVWLICFINISFSSCESYFFCITCISTLIDCIFLNCLSISLDFYIIMSVNLMTVTSTCLTVTTMTH